MMCLAPLPRITPQLTICDCKRQMATIVLARAGKLAGGCLAPGASNGVCASLSAIVSDIFWGAPRRFGILRFRSDASNGVLQLWEVGSWEMFHSSKYTMYPRSIHLTSDSRYLTVGGDGGFGDKCVVMQIK